METYNATELYMIEGKNPAHRNGLTTIMANVYGAYVPGLLKACVRAGWYNLSVIPNQATKSPFERAE